MILIYNCMNVAFLVISSFWSAVGPEYNVLPFMFYLKCINCTLSEPFRSLPNNQADKPVEQPYKTLTANNI